LRDGLHRGPQEVRHSDPDRAWRQRPDRAHRRRGPPVVEARQGLGPEDLYRRPPWPGRPPSSISSTRICSPSSGPEPRPASGVGSRCGCRTRTRRSQAPQSRCTRSGCFPDSAGTWDNLLRGATLGVEAEGRAMATKAGRKAEQAGDSASLEALARVGLIAYGVVHLLIGWLALQITWGASGSKSADTSG